MPDSQKPIKILFFNPAPTQKRFTPFEAMKGSPFFRRPNYDAMRLASISNNHDFVYYDEHVDNVPDFIPDIVVINVQLNLARYVESCIKRNWSEDTTVVCYGTYSTLFPEKNKQFSNSVVIGDIATAWPEILNDLRKNKVANFYKTDKVSTFNVNRSIETKYGFTPIFSQLRTSFGCKCHEDYKDYCDENVLYKEFFQLDIDKVVDEVSCLKRKVIYLLDDDFLCNVNYAVRLLEKCWRYKKMWVFRSTANIFKHPDILPILRDDGVRIIYLKEDWLGKDLLKKLENKSFIKEKEYQVSLVHNYRIALGCKIMLGFEGEDYTFYRRLLKFLTHIRLDLIEVAVQTPMPKSKTHNKYLKKMQIAEDLSLYDQWMPVVNIPGVTPQALYSAMEWLRDRFYSWDSILFRNILVSPKLGFYNSVFFYLIPNLSYRNNFLEKVGYPP